MKKSMNVLAVAVAFVLAGCATAPVAAPAPEMMNANPAEAILRNESLSSVLWQLHAVEYRALTTQAYQNAKAIVDRGIADTSFSAAVEQSPLPATAPTAVIVDVDETVLNTSNYEARNILSGTIHTEELFQKYTMEAIAAPIAGAADALNYARSRGVKVFYVTNRIVQTEEGTRRNLAKHGFPLDENEDTILSKGERPEWEVSDKTPRRAWVASKHRVILVVGDDFNDFVFASGKSPEERARLHEQHRDKWGTKWIMIPNSHYGSWERAVMGDYGLPAAEEAKRKYDALKSE